MSVPLAVVVGAALGVAVGALASLTYLALRDWADDRARERQLADETVARWQRRTLLDLTADDSKPE